MTKRDDLLEKARNNPKGLRFSELCRLAEYQGYTLDRKKGSHSIYVKEGVIGFLDFQESRDGKAKTYQVEQLLNAIQQEEGGES